MKTKIKYTLAALASSLVMSMPVSAETRLLLTGGTDSRVTRGNSYDLTAPDSRFVVVFRSSQEGINSGVRFRVWGLDGDATKFIEVQLAASEGQPLTEGFYDNANPHRWDPMLPHLTVTSSFAGCNYTSGSFEVTQLKVSDDGKTVLSLAANFKHLCDSQKEPLSGEFHYNSDVVLASCQESAKDLTTEVDVLSDSVDGLISEYETLNSEKKILEEELKTSSVDISGIQAASEKLIAELEVNIASQSDLEKQIVALASANLSATASNKELLAEIEMLTAKNKKLKRRNKRVFRLLKALKK
jgi:hypothetical protein